MRSNVPGLPPIQLELGAERLFPWTQQDRSVSEALLQWGIFCCPLFLHMPPKPLAWRWSVNSPLSNWEILIAEFWSRASTASGPNFLASFSSCGWSQGLISCPAGVWRFPFSSKDQSSNCGCVAWALVPWRLHWILRIWKFSCLVERDFWIIVKVEFFVLLESFLFFSSFFRAFFLP